MAAARVSDWAGLAEEVVASGDIRKRQAIRGLNFRDRPESCPNRNRISEPRARLELMTDMRTLVAALIVLAVLYFWDKDYNNGKMLDGLDAMRRDISQHMFH